MRYLSLAEALAIAEAVTGIDARCLWLETPRINLLDSALHAPQASFGGHDMYPEFIDQAAVLAVRISRNHPAPRRKQAPGVDLPHTCSVRSTAASLQVPTEEAVRTMLSVAAGDLALNHR